MWASFWMKEVAGAEVRSPEGEPAYRPSWSIVLELEYQIRAKAMELCNERVRSLHEALREARADSKLLHGALSHTSRDGDRRSSSQSRGQPQTQQPIHNQGPADATPLSFWHRSPKQRVKASSHRPDFRTQARPNPRARARARTKARTRTSRQQRHPQRPRMPRLGCLRSIWPQ